MKKKSGHNKLKILFWLLVAVGCAWLASTPHTQHLPPNAVTVKVQPPLPEEKPMPPVENAPTGSEEQPAVKIPVPPPQELPAQPVVGSHPKIAIVIDDVGLDIKGSERAARLPPFITLSYLPYAARLHEQTRAAREAGHELLLHMPMEPIGHQDPGPGALLVDLPPRDQQQRFETALASFTGFDGVNNHMGSKFTADSAGMTMVVDELQQRHLFYLDSRTSAQSVGKKIAEEKGLPSIGRDVFLDDSQSLDAIRAQLAETERVASRKGYAVAIGHPHVATLDALEQWIPAAQKRGFEFVPVRELVRN